MNSADDKAKGGGFKWNTRGKAGSNGGRLANGRTSSKEPRSEEYLADDVPR